MKIKKYDSGGMAIYTPVMLPPQSQTTTSGATTSSSTSDKKDDEWEIKKVMEMIQKNGLISDVNVTMDELKSFYTTAKSLSSNYLFGGDQSYDILAHMFDVQKKINANVVNYDSWKTAQQNAYNQDALGEVATTAGGNIYVWTEKGITSVSPEEYSKNKGTGVYYDFNEDGSDYLTNDELLVIRKELVPGNPYLISSVNSAKGMDTIRKEIRTIVKDFEAKDRQEYVKREGKNVTQSTWNGMQILIGEGPDGYYKASTKSELGDINSALEYLWESIGQVGRNKLIAEVAISGGDPTKEEDVFRLILHALDKHTASSQDVNFEKTATEYDPDGDGKGETSSSALGEVPYLVRIGRGDGQYELVNISMRTDKVIDSGAMLAYAANMGDAVDKDGNKIPMTLLTDFLTKVEAIKATRSKDITFGGQLLKDSEVNYIIYDGISQLADIWLPYKNIGGKITPDFDTLANFNKWNEWVSKHQGASSLEKMNEAIKMGLDPDKLEFDENIGSWTFKKNVMKLFLNFSGYADNDNVKFTKLTEDITEELPNSEGKKYVELFNNFFDYGKRDIKKGDKKTGLSSDEVRRWDIRRGNIFIPIDSDFLAMHMSMTEYAPKSEMNQFAARSTLAQQIAYSRDNTVASMGQFK